MSSIVCSNHAHINLSYIVSTKAVCPSRMFTLHFSSNINITGYLCLPLSTSVTPPSKAIETIKNPIAFSKNSPNEYMVHEIGA